MADEQINYRIVSRDLETGYACQTIYVAFTMGAEHDYVGIGLSKKEALEKMLEEVEEATGKRWRVTED